MCRTVIYWANYTWIATHLLHELSICLCTALYCSLSLSSSRLFITSWAKMESRCASSVSVSWHAFHLPAVQMTLLPGCVIVLTYSHANLSVYGHVSVNQSKTRWPMWQNSAGRTWDTICTQARHLQFISCHSNVSTVNLPNHCKDTSTH